MKHLSPRLVFWLIFWPNFLVVILLKDIIRHYRIEDETRIIVEFTIFLVLSSLGLLLPIRAVFVTGQQNKKSQVGTGTL
jgi:hypothetical protein